MKNSEVKTVIKYAEGKGRGAFVEENVIEGEFVCEYVPHKIYPR